MLLTEAITKLNYLLRGTDDDAPTAGNDEWNYWVSMLNNKKDELFRDVTKSWDGSFATISVGTVTAGTSVSLALPSNFLAIAGTVDGAGYVLTTGGSRVYFDAVDPKDATQNVQNLVINGSNVQFTSTILAGDQIVGGTLYLSAYTLPADLTTGTDTLAFPDPMYGVTATAADIAFSDLVYEDKAEGLMAKSAALYEAMLKSNRRGTYRNPRRVIGVVNQIRRRP